MNLRLTTVEKNLLYSCLLPINFSSAVTLTGIQILRRKMNAREMVECTMLVGVEAAVVRLFRCGRSGTHGARPPVVRQGWRRWPPPRHR